jgi:hypothetical protein
MSEIHDFDNQVLVKSAFMAIFMLKIPDSAVMPISK